MAGKACGRTVQTGGQGRADAHPSALRQRRVERMGFDRYGRTLVRLYGAQGDRTEIGIQLAQAAMPEMVVELGPRSAP